MRRSSIYERTIKLLCQISKASKERLASYYTGTQLITRHKVAIRRALPDAIGHLWKERHQYFENRKRKTFNVLAKTNRAVGIFHAEET